MHGMVPADQRLGADDRPAVGSIDRLVHELHLVPAGKGRAKVALDHALARQKVVHVAGENLVAAAAVLLGLVKRDVGLAQQVGGVGVGSVRDGDADRGADEDLVAKQAEGLAELAQQALAELLGGAPDS